MGKDSKYGLISLSLILIIFFSMLLITSPVSATSATAPSSPITVQQGGVFLLRGSITFDQAATGAFEYGPVYWYNYGDPTENFRLENTPSVYWTDGTPVENIDIIDYYITDGWQVDIGANIPGIARNGTFTIDIWLRAASGDGTLHAADNENIYFAQNQITFFEPSPGSALAGPITVQVLGRGVDVSISPNSQENLPGENLAYTVTVKNTGNLGNDNYNLTVSDNAGWGDNIKLDNTRLENIPANENRTTTLHVHIPENAIVSTNDNITIKATSQGNENIKDNASCIAHVKPFLGVEVSISPTQKKGLRGWTLTYDVTVWNTGKLEDNFGLENLNNLGWPMMLDNARFDNVPPGDNRTTTLHVTIPNNATPDTQDNVRVRATSQTDITVSAENTCIAQLARVTFAVSVSPSFQSRFRGDNLTYTVTVSNTIENVDFQDNYYLTILDNSNWLSPQENKIENVGRGNNKSKSFTVTIPDNATPDTQDNITVTAISQTDNSENRAVSCIAHSMAVHISITPENQSGLRGKNITYTVKVWSTSTSSENDNFKLTVSDNLGWPLLLQENIGVSAIENGTATLTVTIPGGVALGTQDNITVTVTSWKDNIVKDNARCIAQAGYTNVSLSITPKYQENFRGGNLSYTMTVNNLGTIIDNFILTVQDNADNYPSWNPRIVLPNIYQVADACIRENLPDNNFGGDNYFDVGRKDNGAVRSLLKFSLENIPAGSTIKNVKLYSYAESTYGGIKENVRCYQVDNDNWVENGVIWNNKPGVGGSLDNQGVTSPGWYSWDVTNFINSQHNIDNLASLSLVSDNENVGGDHWARFRAKEYGGTDSDPYLEVEVAAFVISPGENETAILRVPVSWYSPEVTSDNIKVTVTSAENGNISAENSCIASSTGELLSITPIADTYVWKGASNNNYSISDIGYLFVGRLEDNSRRTFLKFDLSGISLPPGSRITGGTVRLFTSEVENMANVQCYGVDNDNWSENNITWNNSINTIGGPISDNVEVTGNNTWYEWDISSFFIEQLETDNIVSLCMIDLGENNSPDHFAKFCSREFGAPLSKNSNVGPHLDITYSLGPFAMQVSVSPEYQSRPRGENITYEVNVKNLGWENKTRNYNLSVSDNAGWGPTVDNRIENVLPGESGSATLRVKIPENAAPGTEDSIAITVINQDNTDVIENTSCIAHSMIVYVSIAPPQFQGADIISVIPGDKLTYTVKVWSTSTNSENDNFRLDLSDKSGWGLSISPENIGVSAPENENNEAQKATAMLTVTIPENAIENTRDNITVTAVYRVDENVRENASCIAQAGYTALKVSIAQKYQSAFPGESLTFSMTVTNTGTVIENFELVDVIPDNENWTWSISKNTFKNVRPGVNKLADLKVEVPSGAPHCTTDNITVRWAAAVELLTKVVYPSDDAYVDQGNRSQNFNTDILTMYPGYNNLSIWPWLKFNLSWPSGAENLVHAKLWVYFFYDNTVGTGAMTGAYFSENNNWSENTITWNNMPSQSTTPTDSTSLIVDDYNAWYVTQDVLRAFTDDNIASWVMKNEGTENNYDTAEAYSKEKVDFSPYLEIIGENEERGVVYASDNCTAHAIHLKITFNPISPDNKQGLPGTSVTFPISIVNDGIETDNYHLTVTDDARWENIRFDDNLFEDVPPGENRTTTLRVNIPDNVTVGMKDNLKVIVTSGKDPNTSENDNCSVLVENFTRGVRVSINPSFGENLPGENLTFTVTVKNLGNVRDNFLLQVNDNDNWSPRLSASSVGLENGTSDNVVLMVRIPGNAVGLDNITVIARSRYDNTVSGMNSCTAHALENLPSSVYGVQVAISPENQAGIPGENLTFTVTVKNTGEIVDTYDLTVSDDAGWGAALDANLLTVLAGENTTATASVTVPSDAVEGDSTVITVTAISRGDDTVSDRATCLAVAAKASPPPTSQRNLLPIVVVGVVAIGGGIAVAVAALIKKGVISLPSIHSMFLLSQSPTR